MNKSYYQDIMQPAFAGMKADAGFDRVETYPSAAEIPFGVVVGADAEGKITAGKSNRAVGIAVHSHAVTGYPAQSPVSVMTRGLVWARCGASDASDAGGAVKFNAQGEIDSTASDTLAHALVRDIAVADGVRLACVELHSPLA